MLWVDSEVHLFPPDWCGDAYEPPKLEDAMCRVIYHHPEREVALKRASVDALLSEMERSKIDMSVIMGLPWREPAMCWQHNAYISHVVERYPKRFIGLGVLPPPMGRNLKDDVKKIAEEYGLKGIKVIPSWQGYRLNDEVFARALEEMTRRNLVLVPHTDHAIVDHASGDPAYCLYDVGRRYPELKIMAPHLGGMICLYKHNKPSRSALENMLFVTSVPTTMQMIRYAVDAVGADRVAFGTDFPFNPSHSQLDMKLEFESLGFETRAKRMIAGDNTIKFLNLSE